LFVGEEVVSARSSKEAKFGGAIREWASAPPAIALVTKREALMSILSAYEDQFPVAGKSKHKEAIPRRCEKPPKVTRSTTE
jgi:hypothetical protein